VGQQPLEPRIDSIHQIRLLAQLGFVRPEHRSQRRA
jgi:hypothetical protein